MRKQIAICIGNDNYQYSCLEKLKCARADCKAMAEKLRTLNYEVREYYDLNRTDMHIAVDCFEKALPSYDIALFYYAGHGFESKGDNLLMPIDTDGIDGDGYCSWQALKLQYVIDAFEGKNEKVENNLKTKIIILDACREDSTGRGVSSRGFAPIFAPEGTIIAFSTSPGQKAIESDGHGAYTSALLKSIDLPRIPIENMFKHTREILSATTRKRQVSWEHTSLMGNYCFNEDRIDAFSFYSSEALADKSYYFNPDNPLSEIVANLKSKTWPKQNPTINTILALLHDNMDVKANDLFVLGRNIYQAAEGSAWKVQEFIKNFSKHSIPLEVKNHLLSGMAYEIFYDKDGRIRNVFKAGFYIEVLKLLDMEAFQMSKNFISSKLMEHENHCMYIPGSESKIELHISCEDNGKREDGNIVYEVKRIFCQGANILSSLDGTTEFTDVDFEFAKPTNFVELKSKLAQYLVAPPDMVVITCDAEDKSNHYFVLPAGYSLRKQHPIGE